MLSPIGSPCQSPMPAVSPSPPRPLQSDTPAVRCWVETGEFLHHVLGMHRKTPLSLEVLGMFSLCHHAEGHRHWKPPFPTISCKDFQDKMISSNLA